nr:hypothetical protein [uncultured Acidovorax sp.]
MKPALNSAFVKAGAALRRIAALCAAPPLQIEAKKAVSPLETRFFPISIGLPVGKRRFRW